MQNKNNESYLDLVKNHIELDKLVYNLPENKKIEIIKLLNKRNLLRKSNNLFSEYKINKINKKIHNIKQKYSK